MGAAVAHSLDRCPYIPHLKHAPGGPGCARAICWSGTWGVAWKTGIACWWAIVAIGATGAGCVARCGTRVVTVRYRVVHTAARSTSPAFAASSGPMIGAAPYACSAATKSLSIPACIALSLTALSCSSEHRGILGIRSFASWVSRSAISFCTGSTSGTFCVAGPAVALAAASAPRPTSPAAGPPCTAWPSHTLPTPAALRDPPCLVPPSVPSPALPPQ